MWPVPVTGAVHDRVMVESWDPGPEVVPADDDGFDDADAFDELDALGPPGGCPGDAREAGDDAVAGLDKITAHMAGGEHRPEQQEMCRAVAEALVTGTHLAVQAGTGTGKSLAYLVPAVLSGQKIVVATATKALPRC
jgi:hypothetical protein